jgi:hypothetical protein
VLAFLIAEAWRLSEDYDPRKDRAAAKGRAPSFASYAEHSLRRRLVDFRRSRYRTRWVAKGYVYDRQRPEGRAFTQEFVVSSLAATSSVEKPSNVIGTSICLRIACERSESVISASPLVLERDEPRRAA